ncbi:helix-turn-helix domain-containing protein [Microbacterium sp. CR_7]|uniref:helix-turn-helix domain-containing protein n=1 Tax=Microbacterium sp. CR_7 TaxID=3055792 RepID=UPI0035C0D05C
MSNIFPMLAKSIPPMKLVRARAKVLAREDRDMRAELVRIRRRANLTQKKVAEQLGITAQAVAKIERYDADPKLSTLRRYANAVGAIVEHRVTVDAGQSIYMASSSRWESNDVPGVQGATWRFATSGVAAHAPSSTAEWSEPKRSEFALVV